MARSNADNQGLLSKEQILQQRKDLFRSLFKGREDVFALRWTSRDGSKSGYMPACSNRWTSLCDRKKYKAPTARTANLLLWVTQKFISTCVVWINVGSLLQ